MTMFAIYSKSKHFLKSANILMSNNTNDIFCEILGKIKSFHREKIVQLEPVWPKINIFRNV